MKVTITLVIAIFIMLAWTSLCEMKLISQKRGIVQYITGKTKFRYDRTSEEIEENALAFNAQYLYLQASDICLKDCQQEISLWRNILHEKMNHYKRLFENELHVLESVGFRRKREIATVVLSVTAIVGMVSFVLTTFNLVATKNTYEDLEVLKVGIHPDDIQKRFDLVFHRIDESSVEVQTNIEKQRYLMALMAVASSRLETFFEGVFETIHKKRVSTKFLPFDIFLDLVKKDENLKLIDHKSIYTAHADLSVDQNTVSVDVVLPLVSPVVYELHDILMLREHGNKSYFLFYEKAAVVSLSNVAERKIINITADCTEGFGSNNYLCDSTHPTEPTCLSESWLTQEVNNIACNLTDFQEIDRKVAHVFNNNSFVLAPKDGISNIICNSTKIKKVFVPEYFVEYGCIPLSIYKGVDEIKSRIVMESSRYPIHSKTKLLQQQFMDELNKRHEVERRISKVRNGGPLGVMEQAAESFGVFLIGSILLGGIGYATKRFFFRAPPAPSAPPASKLQI